MRFGKTSIEKVLDGDEVTEIDVGNAVADVVGVLDRLLDNKDAFHGVLHTLNLAQWDKSGFLCVENMPDCPPREAVEWLRDMNQNFSNMLANKEKLAND